MKKLISILLLTGLCKIVTAQVLIAILFGDKLNTGKLEFGLAAAPALTGISDIESKRKTGFNLGLYFNIRPDKRFFIHAEAIAKASLGAKKLIPYPTGNDTLNKLFAGGSVTRKIKAFSLPVLCRYAITPKFFADAGIQADMMLGAKDIFQSKINENDLDYTIKISSQVSLLDFGIAAGLHYKFRNDKKSMGMGVRYYQGLTDILKQTGGMQANSAWQLIITIPIGTAKANAGNTGNKHSGK